MLIKIKKEKDKFQATVGDFAKIFNPTGAGTWHITEGSKLENGDYQTEMMPLDDKKIEEIKKYFGMCRY